MAVARYLTDPQPQPQQVNINSQGIASPAGVQIDDDQPVQFNNTSGSNISITFATTAITGQRVFNDISLPAGESATESPLIGNITVNYTITINQISYGPYAIEVGAGPLQISVTNAIPNPRTGVIPPNGEIQFTATDVACSVDWENGHDPFTPQVNEVYVGQANNPVASEQGNSGGSFPYSLDSGVAESSAATQALPLGGGGGTIKVT